MLNKIESLTLWFNDKQFISGFNEVEEVVNRHYLLKHCNYTIFKNKVTFYNLSKQLILADQLRHIRYISENEGMKIKSIEFEE